jgi:2-amino-4-hydroxy-6-hydroxymethyldihydropteridine diphosphokinase
MNYAIISAGSNIDPGGNINKAEDLLRQDLKVLACAGRLATRPVGYADQPDFVNTAFRVETALDAAALSAYLKGVEFSLGRIRTSNKSGPRTIDLDIVVFNGTIVDEDVYERDFLTSLVLQLSPELADLLIRRPH